MWVLTTIGFYSVVQDRNHPDLVLVRARVRADLERLRDGFLPELEIVEGVGSDYRFRGVVVRERWVEAAAALAERIDYANFKSAVAARQGNGRAAVYSQVWEVLWGLQGLRS